jgi:predicted DNA-binding protein with PD1-like motif
VRAIVQPGPPARERVRWVQSHGRPVAFDLPSGRLLLDAVRTAFAGEGFACGVLRLEAGALEPLAYVMPALSPTPRHAAFYSETHRPEGGGSLVLGALTFGRRDGEPFFHCHALWREADGTLHGGHILPDETRIGETLRVSGVGLSDAVFETAPDPETNFPLMTPRAIDESAGESGRYFALRLCPNQDLPGALEAFCAAREIGSAVLHGGVGSIIGARFTDGSAVEPFATEMAIQAGIVGASSAGGLEASIDVGLVDLTGAVARGRLSRGNNPILMTLETVLEAR